MGVKTQAIWPRVLASAVLILLAGAASLAENIDPDNDDSQFAHAENVGWLNAEPSGDGGPGVQVDDFELTGYLWGENIGWISLSCKNTSTCATTDYGVINDGHGLLSGFAWSENVGWINFAPGSIGVQINASNGEFIGGAWGENIGWISLSCVNTGSCGTVDFRIRTGWCLAVAAAPAGAPDLSLSHSGSDTLLSWSAVAGADWYEVIQGNISDLSSSGGDFTAATDQCLTDNDTATSTLFSGNPAAGEIFWFLVRGVNCKGKGTYDSGSAEQVGLRDGEVAASPNNCP